MKKIGPKEVAKMSDKELLILRIEQRIKFKKKNLSETTKFHRNVEKELKKKIAVEFIQLKALKK